MVGLSGPYVAPARGGAARALVILLHAYDSDGAALIRLATIWRKAAPDAAFVAPDAPYLCDDGQSGHRWWPHVEGRPFGRAAGVRHARPLVDAFIDQELERHSLSEDRLVLGGFSQGAMLALHVALRRQRRVAGVISFSGCLADEETLDAELRSRPPVLLLHGEEDPIVPVAALEQAARGLVARGVEVATHVSPGLGHGMDIDGLRVAGDFLTRVLGPVASP